MSDDDTIQALFRILVMDDILNYPKGIDVGYKDRNEQKTRTISQVKELISFGLNHKGTLLLCKLCLGQGREEMSQHLNFVDQLVRSGLMVFDKECVK